MADFYLKSGSGVTARANSTAYSLGNRMVIARGDTSANYATVRKWVWECTTAGASGAAVPTWPSSVTQDTTTVTDGTVTWTARKPGYSSGTTADWTFASIYFDYAQIAMTAGDRLFISSNHNESVTGAIGAISAIGTKASPIQILSVADTVAPPTALLSGAQIACDSNVYIGAGTSYFYGVTVRNGSAFANYNLQLGDTSTTADHIMEFEDCVFDVRATGSQAKIYCGGAAGANGANNLVRWKNCSVKFASSNNTINTTAATLEWVGGGVVAGSVSPSNLFGGSYSNRPNIAKVIGVDLSGFSSTFNMCAAWENSYISISNCKLPASWTGSLVTGTRLATSRYKLHNVDSAATNYRMREADYAGDIREETDILMTGGAGISWKTTTTAGSRFPLIAFESPDLPAKWVTAGASITVQVEIAYDGATLTNADVWLDVFKHTDTTSPRVSLASSRVSSSLATGTDYAASSQTWTSSGTPPAVKRTLSVTFTPQVAGYIQARVCQAAASRTVYINPELRVS